MEPVLQSDPLCTLCCQVQPGLPVHACIGQREGDIFQDSQVVEEVELLKHETNLFIPDGGELFVFCIGHPLAINRVFAFRGKIQAALAEPYVAMVFRETSPEPEAPTMVINSPRSISNETRRRA